MASWVETRTADLITPSTLVKSLNPSLRLGHVPTLFVQKLLGHGGMGTAYKCHFSGFTLVVKVANTDGLAKAFKEMGSVLEKEAAFYEHHLMRASKVNRPAFFGMFRAQHWRVIVLEYTGQALKSFDELDQTVRYGLVPLLQPFHQWCVACTEFPTTRSDLLQQVERLHCAGIEHGDLDPRNVTRAEDGKVSIIDFGTAQFHDCDPERCYDLQSLRKKLKLEVESVDNP